MVENTPQLRRPGGRRRDASRDDDLRRVTLELLASIGYDGLTMDAVAERAGAGKGAIYRRWRGKPELVVDALAHATPSFGTIDTGSLREDLYALAAASSAVDSELEMQVVIGLTSALPRDAELRAAFREQLAAPRMALVGAIFDRAVARGEIAPVRNPELLVALMPALLVRQTLVHGAAPGPDYARSIVDDLLLPLLCGPTGGPSPATGC